jgi:hypothetical protein
MASRPAPSRGLLRESNAPPNTKAVSSIGNFTKEQCCSQRGASNDTKPGAAGRNGRTSAGQCSLFVSRESLQQESEIYPLHSYPVRGLASTGLTWRSQYPLSDRIMKPASNPMYYTGLMKELQEAPKRSWLQSTINKWKGFLRFS